MPSLSTLTAILLTASLGQAHISFVRIAHNGVWLPRQKYIRNHTAPYEELPTAHLNGFREWQFPTYPTDFPESIRCGRDNQAWADQTETLKVKAGDTVEFASLYDPPRDWDRPEYVQWEDCPRGRGACRPDDPYPSGVMHDGPAFMWLSRVPSGMDIAKYDGSGDWVKFYTLGVQFRKEEDKIWIEWLPNRAHRLIATIPKQTPAGKYLLRIDQIWPGVSVDKAPPQLYPNCAHIEVESEFTGDLPKGIKIPEAFASENEGMLWGDENWPSGKNGYVYPGGPQWDGEKMAVVRAPKVSDLDL